MNETDVMKHAKSYIDMMAKGIDPITGMAIPEKDTLNNVRISRCLFYVSDVLRQVIENGGVTKRKTTKTIKDPFSITHDDLKRYVFDPYPISVSQIAGKINELIDPETMEKLKYKDITDFLVASGLLIVEKRFDGRTGRIPADGAADFGIFTEKRTGKNGEYSVVLYTREAQQFILDNMDGIIEIKNSRYNSKENQGLPWTPEDDNRLIQLYQSGTDVEKLAAQFKRARSSIRARLKRLGVIMEQ